MALALLNSLSFAGFLRLSFNFYSRRGNKADQHRIIQTLFIRYNNFHKIPASLNQSNNVKVKYYVLQVDYMQKQTNTNTNEARCLCT